MVGPGRRGVAFLAAVGLFLGLVSVGPEAIATPRATRVQVAPASASTVTAAASYPHYGQHGATVRSLQNKLIAAGLLKAQYNSGTYGKRTRTAVSALQRNSHLPRTGRVNAATGAALTAAVEAASGTPTWYHQETIGKSAGGRAIVAYRAGEAGKPVVVVVATMHGEENFGQYVARGLLEGKPIADVDLWVVPVLNPDGLAKDRRWVKGHVDLNRNFPNRFIRRANSGRKAASARETKVVMAFLNRINPRYLVSWHQPLYGVDSYRVKDKGLRNRLAKGLRLPKKSLNCHGSCHGTMTGWFNAHHDGAAITVEYGATARSMKIIKGRDANAVLSAIGGRRL
jgi:protein MpaA